MKQLFVFLVFGPGIAFLGLIGLFFPSAGTRLLPFDWMFGMSYLFGAVPALMTGVLDSYLEKWFPPLHKVLLSSAFGYVASAVMFGLFSQEVSFAIVYGVLGLAAASICSWLCVEKKARTD